MVLRAPKQAIRVDPRQPLPIIAAKPAAARGRPAVMLGIALLIFCSMAAAQVGVMSRQHGEWLSGALISEKPNRFRSLAEQLEAGAYTGLAVDVLEGDCSRRFTTLNVHLQESLPQDLLSAGLAGMLRVDRHPVRRLTYRVGALAGARMIFIFVTEIEGEDAFWKEMLAGQSVRFKFPTERKDYYLRFPLSGFASSQQRAATLCQSLAKQEDRSFFEQ
jgi:hypothetical protein